MSFRCPIQESIIIENKCKANCMYNVGGVCKYQDNLEELELGVIRGMSFSEVSTEVRRAKTKIINVLILDKYVDFVKENYPENALASRKLAFQQDIVFARKKSVITQGLKAGVFKLTDYQFAVCCSSKVFSDFRKANPNLTRVALTTLTGLREVALTRVVSALSAAAKRPSGKSSGKSLSKTQTRGK